MHMALKGDQARTNVMSREEKDPMSAGREDLI